MMRFDHQPWYIGPERGTFAAILRVRDIPACGACRASSLGVQINVFAHRSPVRFRCLAGSFFAAPRALNPPPDPMKLSFSLARPLRLHHLRCPFPIDWAQHAGVHAVEAEAVLAKRAHGPGWRIPAETLFTVSLTPGEDGCASGTLTLESCPAGALLGGPDWGALREAFAAADSASRNASCIPFGRTLAQQMFLWPGHAWALSEVSRELGVESRAVRMRLFREAYSFASTLRRCRMLRLLLQTLAHDISVVLATDPRTPSSRRRLDAMFDAQYQASLSTIATSRAFTGRCFGWETGWARSGKTVLAQW
ncbi:hypothetical protein [Burkholderia sp. 3C]